MLCVLQTSKVNVPLTRLGPSASLFLPSSTHTLRKRSSYEHMSVVARDPHHRGNRPTMRGGCKVPLRAGVSVCPTLSYRTTVEVVGCFLGYLTELFQLQTLRSKRLAAGSTGLNGLNSGDGLLQRRSGLRHFRFFASAPGTFWNGV